MAGSTNSADRIGLVITKILLDFPHTLAGGSFASETTGPFDYGEQRPCPVNSVCCNIEHRYTGSTGREAGAQQGEHTGRILERPAGCPRERGRPARILSPPPRLSTLPADAASVGVGGEPWPGSRLIRAGGVGPGCARTGAGGTPALPGGDCSHPSCSSRGGRTGLPGRRPAHAAEPSRLVTLRGFLFSAFVDNPQLFQTSPAPALPGRSYESETIRNRPFLCDLGIPSRFTSMP